MAEEDAFLVDYVEGGLCIDNTDVEIVGRCNSGSNKNKGKYIAEDSSSKKFLVSNFNNYKMVDRDWSWYNIMNKIIEKYTQHGLKMDESISVSSIIDKLPPSWKDFKHTLKHGKVDLSLVQLGSHLRIEESLRAQDSDKDKGKEVVGPSVNMTEVGENKNNKQNKGKKRDFKEYGSGSSSNKKPKLECWKCGKTGHFKRDCRSVKKNNANAGGSGKGSKNQSQDQGQNLVDAIAWWIDSGATTHVCKDRCWFKTYEPVEDASNEALDKFRIYKTEVELQQNDLIKTLRTDRGGEYYDLVFFQSVGIIHETTAPYTTQQNGIAERKNRALKEMVNFVLSYSGLSEGFWGEAMLTACYLFNRVPNKRNKTTHMNFGIRNDPTCHSCEFGVVEPWLGYLIRKRKLWVKRILIASLFDMLSIPRHIVDETKKFLSSRFSMKDIGEADVILGIKIKRENKGIVTTQSHYIEKILKKFNREDCSPVSTPMDSEEKLKPNIGKPVDQLEYSRAIGCLMYAMTSTRPNTAYVVDRLSRFIFYEWMGVPAWGGAISWASKKQTRITSSIMESEFVPLAAASKEAEWLRNLIHEILIWPKPIAPISIRCDSAPTMARAYSQIYNGKFRHLGARSKGTTYVNMKFSRFKKLGLSFLYVH
nr:hypothetical protein [Tanacetum cinerariifolium]